VPYSQYRDDESAGSALFSSKHEVGEIGMHWPLRKKVRPASRQDALRALRKLSEDKTLRSNRASIEGSENDLSNAVGLSMIP